MTVNFYICGGEIRINKRLFVREILSPSSPLKALLNYELEESDKERVLEVQKESQEDVVTINYTEGSNVPVGEDFNALVSRLKGKYKDAVRGRINLVADYYHPISVTLDLNAEDGRVRTMQL